MKKKIISLMLTVWIIICIAPAAVYADEAHINKIPEGYAAVDGEISDGEWDEALAVNADSACIQDCKNNICVEGASSVSYRAMWDDTYLYLLIEIEDDQLVVNENNATSYRNDSVFVYIGEDADNHSAYSSTTYMLCLFPYFEESDYDTFNENGKTGSLICRNGAHDVSQDKYKCVITGDAESGYKITMEAAIMWDYVMPEVGGSVAFDIQYNDSNSAAYGSSSNNREAIWCWSAVGGDNKGPNTNLGLWGSLEMIAAENPINKPEDDGNKNEGNGESNTDTDTDINTTTTSTVKTPSEEPNIEDNNNNTQSDKKDDGKKTVIAIVIAAAGVLILAAVVVLLMKKKKK